MKKQHKNRFVIVLSVLALLLSSFSIFLPTTVSAASYDDLSIEGKARAYSYYRAMLDCVGVDLNNEIIANAQYNGEKTDPANGYWYGSGDKSKPDTLNNGFLGIGNGTTNTAYVTPSTTSDVGEKGCSQITKTALNDYWGGIGYVELLKALGYKWDGVSKWVYDNSKSGNSTYNNRTNSLNALLKSHGVDVPNVAGAVPAVTLYFLAFNTFTNSNYCKARDNGVYGSIPDSLRNRYGQYNDASKAYSDGTIYKRMSIAGPAGVEEHGFTFQSTVSSSGYTVFQLDDAGFNLSCDELAKTITNNAAAYFDAVATETCATNGYAGAFLAACKDGLKNSATEKAPIYCNKYTDDKLKDACNKGIDSKAVVPVGNDQGSLNGDTTTSSCGIEGMGWILCPLLGFLGSVSDTAFNFLAGSFLETDVKFVDSDSATYNAWQIMRNFANVAFVIAFLIIIFSQLTGFGVSNYGVKKMLPRLVVAAILVNISFFVCQLAVDISNILGYSLKGMFDSMGSQLGGSVDDGTATALKGVGVGTLVAGALVGGVTLLFAITVPILIAVVLALLMIVLILLGRTALIVLLIVVSPLAFVAYLLPNTEAWFKKWYKLLFSLLLLFPIIAVVFGASGLAAKIIYDSANGDMIRQIMAVGVAAVPLFIVPSLLKGALNATGKLGTALSGLANKAGGRVGKKYGETSRLASLNKARQRNAQLRRALITGGSYKGKNPFSRVSSGISSKFNSSGLSGQAGTKMASQAAALAKKLEVEDIEAANAQIDNAGIETAKLRKVSMGGSSNGLNGKDASVRAAAMLELKRRGDLEGLQTSWNEMIASGDSRDARQTRRVVAGAFARSPDKPAFMGQGVLGQVMRSEDVKDPSTGAVVSKLTDQKLETIASNGADKYSSQKISSSPKDELIYAYNNAKRGPKAAALRAAAEEALSNPEISQNIGDNKEILEIIAGRVADPYP